MNRVLKEERRSNKRRLRPCEKAPLTASARAALPVSGCVSPLTVTIVPAIDAIGRRVLSSFFELMNPLVRKAEHRTSVPMTEFQLVSESLHGVHLGRNHRSLLLRNLLPEARRITNEFLYVRR